MSIFCQRLRQALLRPIPSRSSIPFLIAALASLLAPAALLAQDARPAAKTAGVAILAATGPRTSPFNPPEKDIFITDAAPGLDTGCTFNDSPLNPLTIDVMVDRFVGDVDANGFLVNPTPLVSAGIIPAAVDVILPVFDVDFNGAPPPERDEVFFNGQSLGFLTGTNNTWKLNSFRVDIRKIRFPARPAAGASPTPAANRLQISIDTLSRGRWCTSADWVALLLPIRPKLALELDVVAGNPVHSDAGAPITRIFEQKFDANCNVSQTIGPIAQYPFSGPALTAANGTGSAQLRARVKACPEGSLGTPEVTADWSIAGTSRKGSKTWTGADGVVELSMPPAVGRYDATVRLTLDDGQTLNATRRLFVTRKAPLIPGPRVNWYDKGTSWASGQTTEDGIVSSVLTGLYAYGGASWRYGYFSTNKCQWDQLMANPITCNDSDCYVFSDVLTNISGVLGVGGLASIAERGTFGLGFLTTGAPSLDPAFRGNARPLGSTTPNRYKFTSHSLRKRGGTFYDATFNGRYATQRAFIFANFDGTTGADANGAFERTAEGTRVYERFGNVYDSWGKYDYAFLTFSQYPQLAALGGGFMQPVAAAASALSFPGSARFGTVDADANGRFEQLIVDIDVDASVAGDYAVSARLESTGGLLIANRPAFESMLSTRADLSAPAPGRYVVRMRFSGEQIRNARIDGPWRVVLSANSETSFAGSGSVLTPAYRALDFGELKLSFSSLSATPIDQNGNGKFDAVRLQAMLEVATAGTYALRSGLLASGNGLASDSRVIALAAGSQSVQVDLPAAAIARSGIDAPYDILMELMEVSGASLGSSETQLVGYLASQFESPIQASSSLVEQVIDSNGNGLFDLLRVSADLQSSTPRTVTIQARLVAANGASVDVSASASLTATPARVAFDFAGPLLRRLDMSSLYTLELSFRSPTTLQEIDAVSLPLRGVYQSSQFDTGEPPRAISLTGQRTDSGIDTNGNGLFDLLSVSLGIEVTTAGSYEWSGRLVDRNGAELGFASGSGFLNAGVGTITLQFNGRAIGANGLDGPFFIRSVLVAGPGGANLVSPFAGETSAWRASQFEGFVARPAADLNGDGIVNEADLAVFNQALGSSLGEPQYNRFADYDRDGRITLNDLRFFRSHYARR